MLGYEVTKRWGGEGLPDDTISVAFTGSAGQSFGAFLPQGITLRLAGDANDYLGKGLSGGRIVVAPDPAAPYPAETQIIAGNVDPGAGDSRRDASSFKPNFFWRVLAAHPLGRVRQMSNIAN